MAAATRRASAWAPAMTLSARTRARSPRQRSTIERETRRSARVVARADSDAARVRRAASRARRLLRSSSSIDFTRAQYSKNTTTT
jgi:hypothetical protein